MNPDVEPRRVAVVGGGIAGLSAAYELERARRNGAEIRVDLYEASAGLGGVIETERDQGFLLDGGPDSLVAFKPAAVELCGELGIRDELIPTRSETKGVAIYSRGALRTLPLDSDRSPLSRLVQFVGDGPVSLPGIVRMAADLVLPRRPVDGDLSMADFFGRRLGREAVERLIDPLLAGIYAGDPDRLGMRGTFPRFLDLVDRHRSLALGMLRKRRRGPRTGAGGEQRRSGGIAFYSFADGLGRLVAALRERLEGVTFHLRSAVTELARADSGWRVGTEAGRAAPVYAAVLLAVPAPIAAALLRPLAPTAAEAFGSIRYVSSATVFLGYRTEELDAVPDGHGFLIPQVENRRINGATWVSNKYRGRAAEGTFLARCYVGGDRTPGPLELDDGGLMRLCQDELRELAGIRAEPFYRRAFRYPDSNPQYEVGHERRVAAAEHALARFPGLAVTGAGYRGVGIPDCVRDGRESARSLLQRLGAATQT